MFLRGCRYLLYVLILLNTITKVIPVIIDQIEINYLMIMGLKNIPFVEPVFVYSGGETSICTNEFINRITLRSKHESSISSLSSKWVMLCNAPWHNTQLNDQNDSLDGLFMGYTAVNQGDFEDAVLIWKHYPSLSHYFANVSGYKFSLEQFEDALQLALLAREINPSIEQLNYSLNWGECSFFSERNEWNLALPSCVRAANLNDLNRDWLKLGLVYRRLGRYEEALAAYSHVDTVVADYRRATTYENLGDYSKSEQILLEILISDPDFEKAYEALFQLYLSQGRQCDAYLFVSERFGASCQLGEVSVPLVFCDFLGSVDSLECENRQ